MAPQTEADILRALGRIVAGGYVSKGERPVHWCLDCRSALAEAEVDYQDKTSPAIDVRFAVIDQPAALTAFGVDGRRCADQPADLDHHAVDAAGQPGSGPECRHRLRAGRGRC